MGAGQCASEAWQLLFVQYIYIEKCFSWRSKLRSSGVAPLFGWWRRRISRRDQLSTIDLKDEQPVEARRGEMMHARPSHPDSPLPAAHNIQLQLFILTISPAAAAAAGETEKERGQTKGVARMWHLKNIKKIIIIKKFDKCNFWKLLSLKRANNFAWNLQCH